jgi:hypothetical protein
MKKTSFIAALAALAVVLAGAASTAGASSDAGNQLAGTWSVVVNRPAGQPPLSSLQVFTSDGSVIEDANEASATRTASYGSWERIEGRLYAATARVFRFNLQTGAHTATMTISRTIRLSQDGQSFEHVARVTVADPAGNVLQSFMATGSGERMQVERIPEQP